MYEPAYVNYHVTRSVPQAFRFDVNGEPGTLEAPELERTRVLVEDLRETSAGTRFDHDGLVFTSHRSAVETFADSGGWQSTYNAELEALLKSTIDAQDVQVFDHTIRVDDPTAYRKPARNVHNDYSTTGAEQRLVDLLGADTARAYQDGHYGFVNVWRPLEQPVVSSPLGFIRPRSMQEADWMTIDLVYPDRRGEILGVAPSPTHEWVYLSQMTPAEVAIFSVYDNGARPHIAHSALDLDDEATRLQVRKSIESRTLVRYR
ncbi:MAG: CmcJ/NvfI family oxidoreductase [Pseudomonadota bacterium]